MSQVAHCLCQSKQSAAHLLVLACMSWVTHRLSIRESIGLKFWTAHRAKNFISTWLIWELRKLTRISMLRLTSQHVPGCLNAFLKNSGCVGNNKLSFWCTWRQEHSHFTFVLLYIVTRTWVLFIIYKGGLQSCNSPIPSLFTFILRTATTAPDVGWKRYRQCHDRSQEAWSFAARTQEKAVGAYTLLYSVPYAPQW
jgi:hypothetical protein